MGLEELVSELLQLLVEQFVIDKGLPEVMACYGLSLKNKGGPTLTNSQRPPPPRRILGH